MNVTVYSYVYTKCVKACLKRTVLKLITYAYISILVIKCSMLSNKKKYIFDMENFKDIM